MRLKWKLSESESGLGYDWFPNAHCRTYLTGLPSTYRSRYSEVKIRGIFGVLKVSFAMDLERIVQMRVMKVEETWRALRGAMSEGHTKKV